MKVITIIIFMILLSSCAYNGNKSIHLPEGQDFQLIGNGKVHRSCLVKFGQKILNVINDSATNGMLCLKGLKGAGAATNLSKLKELHTSNAITYGCQQIDYSWDRAAANASLNSSYNFEEYKLIHPYISINPNYVLGDSDVRGKVISEKILKEIIFHETFHLIGYYHTLHPEYAYACEECCFPNSQKSQPGACKICSTNYSGISDPEYLKDVWDWSEKSKYSRSVGRKVILRNALIDKPNSAFHLKYFYNESSDNLIFQYLPKSSNSLQKFGTEADPLKPLAKTIAQIEKDLYFKGKTSAAKNTLMNLNTTVLERSLNSKDVLEKKYAVKIWDSILYDMEALLTRLKNSLDPDYKKFLNKHSQVHKLLKSTASNSK